VYQLNIIERNIATPTQSSLSPTVCHSSLAFVLFGKKVKITPPTVLQTGLPF
jgi:hypothetical protein